MEILPAHGCLIRLKDLNFSKLETGDTMYLLFVKIRIKGSLNLFSRVAGTVINFRLFKKLIIIR